MNRKKMLEKYTKIKEQDDDGIKKLMELLEKGANLDAYMRIEILRHRAAIVDEILRDLNSK